MTKPIDRSQQTVEQRTRTVLRENKQNLSHVLPLTDKNPAKYVRGGAVLLPKLPGRAMPNTSDIFARGTYVPGDGERMQSGRHGADDHFKYKSHGNSV